MTAIEQVQAGDHLRQQGDLESAVEAYQAAIQIDPQCVSAYQRLAEVLQELGNLDQSATAYEQAIAVHPEFTDADAAEPVSLGDNSSTSLAPESAEESWSEPQPPQSIDPSISSMDENPEFDVEAAAGDDDDASDALPSIASLQDLIDQQAWAEAIALGLQVVQQTPSALAYKLLGTALQRQGQLDDAFEAYQQALALEPNWAEVWANIGSLEAQQHQWQAAVECYERAIALKPDFAGAYRNLARVLQRLDQLHQSADCWYQAMMLDPDAGHASDYLDLGTEFLLWKQIDRAIDCFRMAVRNDPTLITAYEHLAEALRYKQSQDTDAERQSAAETDSSTAPSLPFNTQPVEAEPELSDAEKMELAKVRVHECLDDRNWQEMIPYCQYILEREPNSDTYRILGNALLQLGQFESAIAAYEKALDYQPDSAEIYTNLGTVYVQQQAWTTAVQHFKQAIALNPDFAGAYRNLARAWQALGKTESAMECWYQALKLEPEKLAAEELVSFGDRFLLWGQTDRAVECYQLAVQHDPSLLGARQKLADLLGNMERWQEAVEHYQVLLRRGRGSTLVRSTSTLAQAELSPLPKLMDILQTTDDTDPDALYQVVGVLKKAAEDCFAQAVVHYRERGNLAQANEDWIAATAAYERVVDLDGSLAIDWGNLGTLYARQEQWEQAIQCYEQAIAIESRASFHWNLAQVLGKLERTGEASHAYYRALTLEPERATPEQHISLGEIFEKQHNLELARSCYERSLQLAPDSAQALFSLARVFSKQEQFAVAEERYRQATEQAPESSYCWHGLGDALSKQKRYEDAVNAYERAIALSSEFSWSHHNLGVALSELGRWSEAVDAYKRAINLNPDFYWSHYNLAEAFIRLGDWNGAIEGYRNVIELEPTLQWLNDRIGALRFIQGMQSLEAYDITSALDYFREVDQVGGIETMPLPFFSPGSPLWSQEWAPWISVLERMKPIDRPWPRITVVTPSLNQGLYIEETILSVTRQQYPNLEYIVVDGGSTDGTKAILSHYRPYLTDLIIEPDRGQSDAINKGFKRATGELLLWLNSDDRLMPGALHMAALTYLQRPCDVIAGICLVHKNRQVQLIRKPLARQADFTVDNLADVSGRWADGYFFYQPEVFFSRSIWDRVGGNVNEELHYAMDHDLWMRCAQVGAKLEVVDYPFALFRKHDQQKTANQEALFQEQRRVAQGISSTIRLNQQSRLDETSGVYSDSAEASDLSNQIDSYKKEGEILLLELHQAQKELEKYVQSLPKHS